MTIVAWMLTRMILVRFLAILLGIALFALTLEAVSYAKQILALDSGHISILLEYMLYRAPDIMASFLPMSLLLALLLSMTELSYRNEITAIWATGTSPYRLIVMLLPTAFLAGGLLFLLSDQGVPYTAPQLRTWGIADYSEKKLRLGENDPLWMRTGTDILRATNANPEATKLNNVIIFRRTDQGVLKEQIFADQAELEGDRWKLTNVAVYYRENLPPSKMESLIYSGVMKPAAAGVRTGDPEEMSVADLAYFIENSGFGIRPPWVYETWFNKRFALFFTPLIMIAICIPLSTRFRRGGGLGLLFAAGFGLGFLYFVTDGIAMTMGELGFVPPWMAAWLPVTTYGVLAVALGLRMDHV